jgi:hypothetical protein
MSAGVPLNVCKKFRALLRSEAERYRTGENAENEMCWVYLDLSGDFSIYRVADVAPWPRPVQWFVAGFNVPEMAEDIRYRKVPGEADRIARTSRLNQFRAAKETQFSA